MSRPADPAFVPLKRLSFGETRRKDAWWVKPLAMFVLLTGFVAYATWAAFQGVHYTFGPYLSPFYSPEVWGDSPHAWFGPKPGWIPDWLPFTPALLILPFPGLFRVTCYYYRGAYYKSHWASPPACAVGKPQKRYRGEQKLPLILQNVHRYFLYFALLFLIFLSYDAYLGFFGWEDGFHINVGSLVLLLNVILLAGYTFGCHSLRHLVGGKIDEMTKRPLRFRLWKGASRCNARHKDWALVSLVWVALADVYVRLASMGIITDYRIL
ncbi:MAG TPA: hypothetical protein VKZ63_16860 [Kofleriaceae bacterium]|nr:hypothetical protein [Kofleriaceae bacterium]